MAQQVADHETIHSDATGGLTVAEAAARVGLTVHTLRWYEQRGLVSPVRRDAAGRRRYGSSELDWLNLLVCLRGTGMSVRDMCRYAELARAGEVTISARRKLFEEHRTRVLARIGELRRDLEVVERKITMYRAMEESERACGSDR